MTMKIRGRNTLPIGVDLGSSTLKMAQLRTSGGGVELLAAGLAEVPPPCREDFSQRLAFFSDSIRSIRKANAFRGRECVLSLPADAIFLHHVKLPKLPPDRIDEALEGELPYPTEDVVISYEIVGDVHDGTEAKQEVIVAAVAQATLDAYLDMAERARLDVVGVDIEAYAIAGCFARQFRQTSSSTGAVLFVDIGAGSTQVVLTDGGEVVFARNLTIGSEQLDRVIAEALDIPVENAGALRREINQPMPPDVTEDDLYRVLDSALDPLANELTRCLRYYDATFRNGSIGQAVFAGGGAYDARACKIIAKRLNLRAQIGDPLTHVGRVKEAGLNAGLDQDGPKPDWAVAVGLSLRATEAEDNRERYLPAVGRR